MKFKSTAVMAVGLALAAGALLPGVAGAETASASIGSGTLALTSQPVTFASATLTGTNQTIVASPASAWVVDDARGTGAAWTATVSATDLSSAPGSVETTPRSILVNNLAMAAGPVTAGPGSDPTTNITGAANLVLSGAGQTIINSTGGSMGSYSFMPSFALSIPANAFRSNYSGTIGSSPLNPYISTMTLTIS